MRVRVVEADNGQAAATGLALGGDVRARVEEEAIRIRREVVRRHRLDHPIAGADEHTAAFCGCGPASVRDHRGDRRLRQLHTASTAIAIPIPPPMHSAATPYRFRRAFNAYSSVVSTRAPLAPIGWPSAIAPPLTLIFSGPISSSRATASDCAANASFSSNRSTSPIARPARSTTFLTAGIGPTPITFGSTPVET